MGLLNKLFKQNEDFVISLAHPDKLQRDTPLAVIPPQLAWSRESKKNKILSLLKLSWNPNENLLQKIANEIFLKEIFGLKEDMSEPLFDLMIWHYNRNWKLDNLTDSDKEKSEALEGITALTRKRYWEVTSPNLNLKLGMKAPQICILLYPVVAKIPIKSIQYFVDIHSRYAFDSIRKSKHQYADDIISYLYEVLFLQQKIAVSLHSFICSIDITNTDKNESMLIKNEMDAIISADTIFAYLKASIEKTIALIGYTFNITKLEDKKTHKVKIKALNDSIPDSAKQQPYFQFVEEFISSDNLDQLNNYRTGLLHKKGISELQPHNYYGKSDSPTNLSKLFEVLHEQHSKNSAIIIGAIALLTDELVKIDPPNFKISELPFDSLTKTMNIFMKNEKSR